MGDWFSVFTTDLKMTFKFETVGSPLTADANYRE